MKIQIVYQEGGWIFEALAFQWQKAFEAHGKCEVVQGIARAGADVYFHFYHGDAKLVKEALNVVYVTHISNYRHAVLIQSYAMQGALLITMSAETAEMVTTLVGNSHQVLRVLPESIHFKPADEKLKPFRLGYFSRRYEDKRKKDHLIQDIIDRVEQASNTKFLIFGSGWSMGRKYKNVEIDEGAFVLENYRKYLDEVDVAIALGQDEGAISILDAATCGVPVFTTTVGYHSEIPLARGSRLFDSPEMVHEYIVEEIDRHERSSSMTYPSLASGAAEILERLSSFDPPKFRRIYILNIFRIRYVHGFWVNLKWLFAMIKLKNFAKYFR